MSVLVSEARLIAEQVLAGELPRRWRHVQAVAAKASRVAVILDAVDREVLTAAAWLHDIGYAAGLGATGFHPLDGARWLRLRGFDPRVTGLVANHSAAVIEADVRGLGEELRAEFPAEDSATADALIYCDMTTGPDGQDFDVPARLAEIRSRYGDGHVVTRFIDRAEPAILAAAGRVQARLSALVG